MTRAGREGRLVASLELRSEASVLFEGLALHSQLVVSSAAIDRAADSVAPGVNAYPRFNMGSGLCTNTGKASLGGELRCWSALATLPATLPCVPQIVLTG